jgi:hypothetical protein
LIVFRHHLKLLFIWDPFFRSFVTFPYPTIPSVDSSSVFLKHSPSYNFFPTLSFPALFPNAVNMLGFSTSATRKTDPPSVKAALSKAQAQFQAIANAAGIPVKDIAKCTDPPSDDGPVRGGTPIYRKDF